MTAVEMDALGYGPLIPIVPPNGKIASFSRLKPENRGKMPGRWTTNGWVGIDWRHILIRPATIDSYNGNVGLLLDDLIAIDVDVRDTVMSKRLQEIVVKYFDRPPVARVGEPPKIAFLCRRSGPPMTRMQLHFNLNDRHHLVELLALGQQIVVQGLHPRTLEPYTYPYGLPPASELPVVDADKIAAMFNEIEEYLKGMEIEVSRSGAGKITQRDEVDQESLVAPIELVQEILAHIPNDDVAYPTRQSWIEMGMAIKAATVKDPFKGFEIWREWSVKYGDENTEEKILEAWDSFKAPFSIGIDYLLRQGRKHGYSTAYLDFEPITEVPEEAPSAEIPPKPPGGNVSEYSHLWLVERMIDTYGGSVRWVNDRKVWYAYRNEAWNSGPNLIRPYAISFLSDMAKYVYHQGLTAAELRASRTEAKILSSKGTIDAVSKLAEDMARVQARVDTFDNDPDLLGVPGGFVDLRTGEFHGPDRDRMISLCTTVPPKAGPAPLWEKFLDDAMGSDLRKISYLKRLSGYCLTGRIEEHVFFLLWGGGGNGKSTFLNTLAAIMGEYCRTAQMDTFTATQQPAHPAAVAALAGARMVQSQETRPGQRWDETLLKQLTGGDAVTARFLFGQPFTYIPTFKLAFSGNHQPRLTSVGEAMKRRFHILPFDRKPTVPNKRLSEQLREEHGAILAWAIEGARDWYQFGLCPPDDVINTTREYLENEDELSQWLKECCLPDASCSVMAASLYDSWMRWAHAHGVYPGSQVIFGKRLREAGYLPNRETNGGEFLGLQLKTANKPN